MDPVDYSEFQYQHIDLSHIENGDNSARATTVLGVSPLEQSGGLDINEVAELVYIRVQASVAGDDFGDIADTAQGNLDFRGVIGANLDSEQDLIDETQNAVDEDATILEAVENSGTNNSLYSHDKEEVFYHFTCYNDTPFSSDAGGVGGGGGGTFVQEQINFRDLVGRGPVLDSNDEINFVTLLAKNQVSADAEGKVRVTMVWDTATVDDAGRKFSIPQDD